MLLFCLQYSYSQNRSSTWIYPLFRAPLPSPRLTGRPKTPEDSSKSGKIEGALIAHDNDIRVCRSRHRLTRRTIWLGAWPVCHSASKPDSSRASLTVDLLKCSHYSSHERHLCSHYSSHECHLVPSNLHHRFLLDLKPQNSTPLAHQEHHSQFYPPFHSAAAMATVSPAIWTEKQKLSGHQACHSRSHLE